MSIWAYLAVGCLMMINWLALGLNLSEKPSKWYMIGVSIIKLILWPLDTLVCIGVAIWCRIKPEHRILFDFIEQ